ncbi:hypothetical protein [Streptomyces sp. NPDC001851]
MNHRVIGRHLTVAEATAVAGIAFGGRGAVAAAVTWVPPAGDPGSSGR